MMYALCIRMLGSMEAVGADALRNKIVLMGDEKNGFWEVE